MACPKIEPAPTESPIEEGVSKPMAAVWQGWFGRFRQQMQDLQDSVCEIVTTSGSGTGSSSGSGGSSAILSWTPSIAYATPGADPAYAFRVGSYLTSGNLVFFSFDILLVSAGTGSGAVTVNGLPFTVNTSFLTGGLATIGCPTVRNILSPGNPWWLSLQVLQGTTSCTVMNNQSNVIPFALDFTQMTNSSEISASGWYAK